MPVYSVEAPVGGWNARDSQDNLPETDALELINMVPAEGYVISRGGFDVAFTYTPATYGTAGVETIAPCIDATGDADIILGVGGYLINLAVSVSASGFTEDRWQYTNSHGRLIFVNGSDAPQEYDGSTLGAISGIGGSGLTVSDLIGVMPFKGRVFYWENGATSFWYPGPGEYKNASMSEYDMAQFLTKGGSLTLAFTWTLDGGAGMDDLAVFVFSSGETLVYQGSDPGSASDWALVGRFEIGEPLGIRSHCRLGADHVILTRDGYERISFSLQNGKGLSQKLSDKIDGAVRTAIENYADNVGWEVVFNSSRSLLVVNVPISPGSQYEQHVLNINTGAWAKWDGKFITMAEGGIEKGPFDVSPTLLFGGVTDATSIGLGAATSCIGFYDDDATIDEDEDVSDEPVEAVCTQITQFGKRAVRKQLTGINFITTLNDPSAIEFTTAADFNLPTRPSPSATPHDGSEATTQQWRVAAEAGYAVSFTMAALTGDVNTPADAKRWKWYATQMTYKVGGPV